MGTTVKAATLIKTMNSRIRTLLLASTLVLATETTAYPRLNLPQMGEPADLVMSPRDEMRIGRGFMRQIRTQLDLVTDPEVNDYVQRLGKRLVSTQPGVDADDFTFFVVRNPEINAFAIPGGFIGINSGLITAAGNESQLASVVAHEAAHVLQRHIARSIASQGNQGLKTAAAIVAAILISQRSTEAGQAALLTGLAASRQSSINFTRSNEYDADRLGIQLLSDANYNPRGMVDFFEVLRRRTALNVTEQLEFLQTHPLTINRISEARNNAERLVNPVGIQDSTDFQFQQMKLKVMHSNTPDTMLRALRNGHISNSESARLYGQILLHLDSGQLQQATPLAERLLELQPYNNSAKLIGARVAMDNRDYGKAELLLTSITDIQPDNYAASDILIDTLLRQKKNGLAEQVIRQYLRSTNTPVPTVYRKYARVHELNGQLTAAHEAMADHYFSLDETREGMGQLELALKSADEDSNDSDRVSARLEALRKRIADASR